MSLTRRNFLSASTALAAAASPVLAASVRALQPKDQPSTPPTPAKRTLRKAVMFYMIADGKTLLEKFQILKDAGFEGVEMDSPSQIPPDDILAAQEKTGIKVHGLVDSAHWKYYLNSPEPEIRRQGQEALQTALRDAKKFGAISVLLVPGLVNENQPYDEAWKLTQEEIRKALPLARECNVKIAVENVWNWFLLSPLEAARYVDEFNDPLLAFHFDIGNFIPFGYPDQWIRILGKRIVKLHFKDYSRKKRDAEGFAKGFNVELGEGDAGWPAVMKALDTVGYSTAPGGNWATAEVAAGNADHLKKVAAQMDRIFGL